jgi:hypothetical protein
MNEKINNEINKVTEINKYNKQRASKLMDDIATAYLMEDEAGEDTALIKVKGCKKSMRANGVPQHIIEEAMLYRPLSKVRVRDIQLDSIYQGDGVTVHPIVERQPALYDTHTTTDILIDGLKSRPELLSALQRGVRPEHIQHKFHTPHTTLLVNFYSKHREIID